MAAAASTAATDHKVGSRIMHLPYAVAYELH